MQHCSIHLIIGDDAVIAPSTKQQHAAIAATAIAATLSSVWCSVVWLLCWVCKSRRQPHHGFIYLCMYDMMVVRLVGLRLRHPLLRKQLPTIDNTINNMHFVTIWPLILTDRQKRHPRPSVRVMHAVVVSLVRECDARCDARCWNWFGWIDWDWLIHILVGFVSVTSYLMTLSCDLCTVDLPFHTETHTVTVGYC